MGETVSGGAGQLRERGLLLLRPCLRQLIGLLAHTDPHLRAEAARALGRLGSPEAVEALIEALRRERQDEQVPLALAEIGDLAALDPLLTAFQEADRDVRHNIAQALGAFADPRTAPTLIRGLADPDPNVRFNCASALGQLGDRQAVSPLLAAMSEPNEWISLNAVAMLARLEDHRATSPIAAMYLKERNERKRAALVAALGRLRDPTAVPTLTRALRDPDHRVKANAIEAFENLGLPADKLAGLVLPFLKHPDNRVRGNALIAMVRQGREECDPVIVAMRSDPDKWMRATLGYVLSIVDHPQALVVIGELLRDEDADVKKNAARALVARADERQLELLLHLLTDGTSFVRQQAVALLGRLRVAAAVPALLRLFSAERSFQVRSLLISVLGEIGEREAVPLLGRCLRDRDSRVRANTVEALERILGEESLPLLLPLLQDPDNRTRANAVTALFRWGELRVLDTLSTMLGDRDRANQVSAAYALGQIGLLLASVDRDPVAGPLHRVLGQVRLPPPSLASSPGPLSSPSLAAEAGRSGAEGPAGASAGSAGSGDGVGGGGREAQRQTLMQLVKAGRLKEAVVAAEGFVAEQPQDLAAQMMLGNLYVQCSEMDKALVSYRQVLQVDPFAVQGHVSLAVVLYRVGRSDEAIAHFRQALTIQPDLAPAWFNLGNILVKEGRWEEAVKAYEEGRRHQPSPPARVLASLGFAWQKLGHYDKAIGYLQTSATADPRDPGVFYNWAVILLRQGRRDEARKVLEQALASVPAGAAGLQQVRELLERL